MDKNTKYKRMFEVIPRDYLENYIAYLLQRKECFKTYF